MKPEIAQVLMKWIEENDNNALSIFELDEEGNIRTKKMDDKEVIVYINPKLEKELKEHNFKEEEIRETIKELLVEITKNIKNLEKENLE